MRVALCRLNPTVGEISANAARILDAARDALVPGADLLLLPELALVGYPPKDLLLHHGFVDEAMAAAHGLARDLGALAPGMLVVVGAPWFEAGALRNALLAMRNGRIETVYSKQLLPTYDVFDEDRYFTPSDEPRVVEVAGVRVGLTICEDLWRGADAGAITRYRSRPDPVAQLVAQGASLVVNASASPFVLGKAAAQRRILAEHAARADVAVCGVNQLGGNDELVFDGHAIAFVPDRRAEGGARLVACGRRFRDDLVVFDLPADRAQWPSIPDAHDLLRDTTPESLLYDCLVLGVRDYCRKTGFSKVVLGVSGGIDSAVTGAIAAAALGPESVLTLAMPSRFSSSHALDDARSLCDALGLRMLVTPIEDAHALFERTLAPQFASLGLPTEPGVTEENIQSRLRGLTLMAFSNKTGALLLTTGNKSELAVGYCTLYGDMNGGLAVLSDVTKEWVYRLARHINANHLDSGFARAPIPVSSIDKPPSAELRPNQTDQDSLPPYEVVDRLVELFVEERLHPREIVAMTGFDPKDVARIVRLIDLNEYKRKQAAIGIKVSGVAFGSGRRMPIAQAWRSDRAL
ncbi:MAG: NAD+ synthase [Phycisphaeraceae bacterium]|nr:NAD+ synthase [Phycisphaeraceae bacterium]